MSFKHITAADRVKIATLLEERRTNSYIARRVGVNRSTIGREIARNQSKPKPKPLAIPTRPTILDTDCRKFRGQGIAQDKYEAAVSYAQQVAAIRQHNRYYVAHEADVRAASRRRAANGQRTRIVHGSGSWLEQYTRQALTKDQSIPGNGAATRTLMASSGSTFRNELTSRL